MVHADREQRILQLSCFKLICDVLRPDNTDLVGITKDFQGKCLVRPLLSPSIAHSHAPTAPLPGAELT